MQAVATEQGRGAGLGLAVEERNSLRKRRRLFFGQ